MINESSVFFSFEPIQGSKQRTTIINPKQYVIDELLRTVYNAKMTVFDAMTQEVIIFSFNNGQWHEVCNRVCSNKAA